MCMQHRCLIALAVAAALTTPAVHADQRTASVGLESRTFYARWYEYPGIYYEENFSLMGVRGELLRHMAHNQFNIDYGIVGSLYGVGGSYKDETGTSYDASGARVALAAQMAFSANSSLDFIARGEVAYLAAFGSAGGGTHTESFTDHLGSIDLGLGAKFRNVNLLGASSMSLTYSFPLIDLGVGTNNWVSNTPSSDGWSSSSLMLTLDYDY